MLAYIFSLQMIVTWLILACLEKKKKNVALVISFPAMHTSRENYDLNPEVRTN